MNKKINLDHVKSVIDKKKVNAKFLKNGISIDDQIFVKGEKNKIDYEEFYEQNKKNLVEMKNEVEKEKIINHKKNHGRGKKLFEPLPIFDKTNNEPVLQNFVVMKKGDSKRHLEKKISEEKFVRGSSDNILTPFEITRENFEIEKIKSKKNFEKIKNMENEGEYENNHVLENANNLNYEKVHEKKNYVIPQNNYSSVSNEKNSDIKTLKKYIMILNGKFKELNSTVQNLQNSNIYLTNKVNSLEKTLFNYSSFFQPVENKKKVFQSFAQKSFAEKNYSFPDKSENLSPSTNNSNLPVLLFSQAQGNSIYKLDSSKWKKNKKNINDQLFDIFSSPENSAEKDFITFLRSSENLRNFKKIENSLLIKIFKKLTLLLNKNINGDILIIEYTLLWFKTFLDNNKPENRDLIQQLYTVLFLLVNTSYDESVKNKANLLLGHKFLLSVIKGGGRGSRDDGSESGSNNFFKFDKGLEEESEDDESEDEEGEEGDDEIE